MADVLRHARRDGALTATRLLAAWPASIVVPAGGRGCSPWCSSPGRKRSCGCPTACAARGCSWHRSGWRRSTRSPSWRCTRSASEPVMAAILVPQIPLAYLLARYAVARARRGDVPIGMAGSRAPCAARRQGSSRRRSVRGARAGVVRAPSRRRVAPCVDRDPAPAGVVTALGGRRVHHARGGDPARRASRRPWSSRTFTATTRERIEPRSRRVVRLTRILSRRGR